MKIDYSKLLNREEFKNNIEDLYSFYKDKKVFVTGGCGSIGSEIIKQLLLLPIQKVICFDHVENELYYTILKYENDARFIFVIGDIRDQDKLDFEMGKYKPDIIFHAGAHKHVPLLERYIDEAIKNNIFGTYNCAMFAIKHSVKNFVLISTDKAVNPTSIMGSSKRIAEKIILTLNKEQDKTRFSLVRFGNVLGSNGSILPILEKKLENQKEITLTHPDIERYFMTISEASGLVIKSVTLENGNTFVLDMGEPIKIIDLIKRFIELNGFEVKSIPIIITGLRPGEKLYEELISENCEKTFIDRILVSNQEEESCYINILEMLDKFQKSLDSFDNDKMIELIKFYVPEYRGIR